eukprot:763101_1
MSQHPLWTFIKSSQATKLVSLRLLQQFILSLTKTELIHLIQHYLQSKLSECTACTADGLTLTQTLHLYRNEGYALPSLDQQIMSKLNMNYAKKYTKKVISKIQQCNTSSKPDEPRKLNLLSIPPHVLAYSFQFSTYKELCKVQSVCAHFVYLNTQYPALTHHHLALDKHFCQKAMRFKVPLANLKYFKHISIRTAYCNSGGRFNGGGAYQRTVLFQYLLKRIVKQSQSHLDALTITIYYCRTNLYSLEALKPFSVLLYIMNEFQTLNISTLKWESDLFKPQNNTSTIADMLLQIGSNLVNAFPNLKVFKQNSFGNALYPMDPRLLFPVNSWRNHVVRIVNDFGEKLELLDLTSDSSYYPFDIFATNVDETIQIIAKNMHNLKTLCVATSLQSMSDKVVRRNNITQCTVLNKLCFELNWNGGSSNDGLGTIALNYLFSTFIGITEFEFKLASGFHSYIRRPDTNNEFEFGLDWKDTLFTLITNKETYSMNPHHEVLLPLESLCIDCVTKKSAGDLMKDLSTLKYFALKRFSVTIDEWKGTQDVFNKLVFNHFVPYLTLCDENGAALQDITFTCNDVIRTQQSYLQPLIHILSNIPRTVTRIQLHPPYYLRTTDARKNIAVESTKLVKKLSSLLSNKNNKLKLETITIKNLTLSKNAKTYLLFLFGFNNNIYISNGYNNCYYLHFPS